MELGEASPTFVSYDAAYLMAMRSASLLRHYVKLIVETTVTGAGSPLQLGGPFWPAKKRILHDGFTIYREFPVVATPDLMKAMGLEEADLDEDGTISGEHEIVIEFSDIYHTPAEPATWHYPGAPEEFIVENYDIISFNGLQLTSNDEKALIERIGNLTDEEQDRAYQHWKDSFPDPEPDDYY